MKNLIEKYKHGWVLSYFIIYLIWFFLLEKRVLNYSPVHITLDDYIPFNEWFILPYVLWFAYIFLTVAYMFFTSKTEFYQCTAFLFIGMSICLLIYTIYPNGQNLRVDLDSLGRNNILITMVSWFYNNDTNTNVLPSIHVFNSIAAQIAISRNKKLSSNPFILYGSLILCVLICLSTVFLKQHSALDGFAAIALSIVMYLVVYLPYDLKHKKTETSLEYAK